MPMAEMFRMLDAYCRDVSHALACDLNIHARVLECLYRQSCAQLGTCMHVILVVHRAYLCIGLIWGYSSVFT